MKTRLGAHPVLIVPGLGGSGPGHWQVHWAERLPRAQTVAQQDWERPELTLWLARLRAAVDTAPGAVLVGHSLGCVLIAHLAQSDLRSKIAGALLVAPADVEACSDLPGCIEAFRPIPRERLPFRSALVASTNDPYMTIDRARDLAAAWGAQFHDVGACGHINIAAGFGPWPEGEFILEDLCAAIEADKRAAAGIGIPRSANPRTLSLS